MHCWGMDKLTISMSKPASSLVARQQADSSTMHMTQVSEADVMQLGRSENLPTKLFVPCCGGQQITNAQRTSRKSSEPVNMFMTRMRQVEPVRHPIR